MKSLKALHSVGETWRREKSWWHKESAWPDRWWLISTISTRVIGEFETDSSKALVRWSGAYYDCIMTPIANESSAKKIFINENMWDLHHIHKARIVITNLAAICIRRRVRERVPNFAGEDGEKLSVRKSPTYGRRALGRIVPHSDVER